MSIEVDLHIYTKYSFDSLLEPKTVIKLAKDLDKPAIACSDAHFSFEVERARTKLYSHSGSPEKLRELILNDRREFIEENHHSWYIVLPS